MDTKTISEYDIIYERLASAKVGYIEAPAGCGKTEAIVQVVNKYCYGKQLILTHTNAGVQILKKRFQKFQVDPSKYYIDTISGWSLNWVKHYPQLGQYNGNLPIPQQREWKLLYEAARRIINKPFAKKTILNSYSGVIIDEYQDCTISMHNLILELKNTINCRILGDPLQGIFDLNEDALINWENVISDFENDLGKFSIPYRWKENKKLGEWLFNIRYKFKYDKVLSTGNDIPFFKISSDTGSNINSILYKLLPKITGSVCFIKPKHGIINKSLETILIKQFHFYNIEPRNLPILGTFLTQYQQKPIDGAIKFIEASFSSLNESTINSTFIQNLFNNKVRSNQLNTEDKIFLYSTYSHQYSDELFLNILQILKHNAERHLLACKKPASVNALINILSESVKKKSDLNALYVTEVNKRKYSIKDFHRCIGTTLLIKGLEFDNVVIYYMKQNGGWENANDLYVALTRACRNIYLITS